MRYIDGGVCASKGFKATGLNAGIKNNVKKDMALVFSEMPCVKAGTFTTNRVCAAPVKWDKKVVFESKSAQAIVVNSGIANACTGEEGYEKCREMAAKTAEKLGIDEDAVLVASTGVIGKQLPMDIIGKGIDRLPGQLGETAADAALAAEAIMTTDTKSKQVAVEFEIEGTMVHIGGMCKGSGMIHPNMATMLCFITSDAAVDEKLLQNMVRAIVDDTFPSTETPRRTIRFFFLQTEWRETRRLRMKTARVIKSFMMHFFIFYASFQRRLPGTARELPVSLKYR